MLRSRIEERIYMEGIKKKNQTFNYLVISSPVNNRLKIEIMGYFSSLYLTKMNIR